MVAFDWTLASDGEEEEIDSAVKFTLHTSPFTKHLMVLQYSTREPTSKQQTSSSPVQNCHIPILYWTGAVNDMPPRIGSLHGQSSFDHLEAEADKVHCINPLSWPHPSTSLWPLIVARASECLRELHHLHWL